MEPTLNSIVSKIIDDAAEQDQIMPSWVADEAYREMDPNRISPALVNLAAHEALKQIARQLLRGRFEPDRDDDKTQHKLWPDLQERYPLKCSNSAAEPIYAKLKSLKAEDLHWNINRLRHEGEAKLKHARALENWAVGGQFSFFEPGARSAIEWTTWNPVTGCSKVSQGCKNCYAERIFSRSYPGRAFTDVRCHPERLAQPLTWKRPRRIFVNSMSDLFHPNVPDEFILKVIAVMFHPKASHHTYQILTKRPERMRDFITDHPSAWPRRIQFGVSVEDQATADDRIPKLLVTPAAVRFVSAEPLLGRIDLSDALSDFPRELTIDQIRHGATRLDWIIAGGESGRGARPMQPEWARSLRDQCHAAGVPFFFKQWGEWAPDMRRVGKKAAGAMLDGREWKEYPAA